KEKSSVTISAEGARLQPGHSSAIGSEGTVYIDDFEGTQTSYDLRFPFISWKLASTPQDPDGGLFPEASKVNDWSYGYNRSKLSWYNIDPFFFSSVSAPDGIKDVSAEQSNFYSRQVSQVEIFPSKDFTNNPYDQRENTFDLRYEPMKRGPYNFDTSKLILLKDGSLGFDTLNKANLTQRWGGIQRSIDQTDFEQANIEYIQFWVLDPFLNNKSANRSGDLYVDLGNISEDVLKDSKFFYENGISPIGDTTIENSTTWGYSPKIPPITNAFDNDPNSRQWQDVGYDGIRDSSFEVNTGNERYFFRRYIDAVGAIYGVNSPVYNAARRDPSNDNYLYFDDETYNNAKTGILDRYSRYNNPEGNSPITTTSQNVSSAATNQPESEDLNRDNTITENEEYFHYKIHIDTSMVTTGKFVTDAIDYIVPNDQNNYSPGTERWIQIKVPLNEYLKKVGSIQDFKSIRFVRMYLAGFDTTVVLRFARMELVRNQWRKYLYSLESPGESLPGENDNTTSFNVSSVSLEENSSRSPINYVLPPGIQQEQIVGQIGTQYQNEQSLSIQVCNLKNGDAIAVYKNINLDIRQYDRLKMFIHAEQGLESPNVLKSGDVTAFIRLGTDFTNNYYEYEVPLTVTEYGATSASLIWPTENSMDILLTDLVAAKSSRNQQALSITKPYTIQIGNNKITIVGNPDLGQVVTAMLGVRNPKAGLPDDDGESKCAEIWYDELRLSGFNEQAGNAGIARAEIKMADFGNLAASGSFHTIGFGQLEQKLNERFKDNYTAFDMAATLQLGKFFPKKIGVQLPFYAGLSKSISTPEYDPYDHDIKLKDKLDLITDAGEKHDAKSAAQLYTSIGSLNFSNVRLQPTGKNTKVKFYSPSNLNFTYAYTRTFSHSPIISQNLLKSHHAELGYAFPGKSKFIYPLQNIIGSKSKYLKIIRDINFNFLPTNLAFRTAVNRQFGELYLRPLNLDEIIIPTYNKYFTWDRFHGIKFDLSKALTVDFNAVTNTRIDEPEGLIDTKEKKDSIWRNILDGGRTTTYNHSSNLNYTLPFNKIPILDWTQTTFRYGATYAWITAPLVLDSATQKIIPSKLGNTISNGQNIALNGDFNLRNLYNKSKFLKKYDTNAPVKNNTPKSPGKNPKGEPSDTTAKNLKNSNTKKKGEVGAEKTLIRLPLLVKRVSVNFTQAEGTILPGYLFKPDLLGSDLSKSAPGLDFIFGYQPDSNWLNQKAKQGWISSDTNLNYQFVQTTSKQFSMKWSLEPFKDVLIDINFNKSHSDNISEYFKKPDSQSDFEHLSRMEYGTYSQSYLAIGTSFSKIEPNKFSALFLNFQDFRETISSRLTILNPASNGEPFGVDTVAGNYYKGYGPYSQDVLIPAFIAAYTGKDPSSISLGLPFANFPLPNWNIKYSGLTKMPWAKKIWNNVNITHAYTSTFTIGTFNSALNYFDNGTLYPSTIDLTSGNFVSFYDIPVIVITEQFSPFLGIDMTWKNSLSTKIEYKRSRSLAFSFLDYQLTEARTEGVTIGIGYKFKHVPIPWKVNGKKTTLRNDLNFQFNISYDDNVIYSQKLDQLVASQPTSGIQSYNFSPAVDYTVNNRLNVRVFFDKRITNPKISSSYPIRYTDGGVTIRFTLGQ
ncbi:MAG: cell surface protein SprA, partial [Chitinophagales bacterium]|nr:cell surface protein SprA [Chitinophagales bacterium]